MKRLNYTIEINAKPEEVFRAISAPESFQKWSSVFSPTSRYKGEWKEGAEVEFQTTEENGEVCGLLTLIKAFVPYEYISIEYCAVVQNGEIIRSGPMVDPMKGGQENYRLTPKGQATILEVESDAMPDFEDFFEENWPKALDLIAQLAEK